MTNISFQSITILVANKVNSRVSVFTLELVPETPMHFDARAIVPEPPHFLLYGGKYLPCYGVIARPGPRVITFVLTEWELFDRIVIIYATLKFSGGTRGGTVRGFAPPLAPPPPSQNGIFFFFFFFFFLLFFFFFFTYVVSHTSHQFKLISAFSAISVSINKVIHRRSIVYNIQWCGIIYIQCCVCVCNIVIFKI